MGSVDKFGRPFDRSVGGGGGGGSSLSLRGPKGEGFILDKYGNYLVSYKRIKQLDDPEDERDAVNKRWLELRIKPVENKLETFEQDKQNIMFLCSQATDIGQKSFDKATSSESSLKQLSNRLKSLEDRFNTSVLENSVKDLTNRVNQLEKSINFFNKKNDGEKSTSKR